MAALTGNKYAEKWTFERTLDALRTVESYSYSKDCLYLGHALSISGYYSDVWVYWRKKWSSRFEVRHLMNQILQRFEARLFDKMAKKEIPAQAAMFALKHHYGWGGERSTPTLQELEYLDKEPKQAPKPEPQSAAQTPTETTTPSTQEPSPNKQHNPPAKPLSGREYMLLKKKQYNEAHPMDPIITDAAFFDGKPPSGMPAILFEDGYFLKC